MQRVIRSCLLAFPMLLAPLAARGENWPGWRGPRGDGTSEEKGVPTQWSAIENIAWKVPLPGSGHASPVVWGDSIFVASCNEGSQQRLLTCFDRRGTRKWEKVVLEAPLEKKHGLNSFASGTPAADGECVYAAFLDRGEMVVAAYACDGVEKWRARPGVFSSVHGFCSCPVVFENLLIVNGDHDGESYLVALDRKTGETVWKTPRENKTRSYCTPIIRDIAGRTQMLISGSMSIASYDPRTGARQWNMRGPTEQFVASPVYDGKLLFITAGFPDHHILAIRPEGTGDITDTNIVWRTTENCSYVPSPIVVGDYFLIVSDEGIASCYLAADGKLQWRRRIGPHYSASLVAADGLAYFLSDEGETLVVRPGPTYDEVASNSLGEPCYASPAISDGDLIVRGETHLFCIRRP
jgi:outer membrane protein assembly factor BamB